MRVPNITYRDVGETEGLERAQLESHTCLRNKHIIWKINLLHVLGWAVQENTRFSASVLALSLVGPILPALN